MDSAANTQDMMMKGITTKPFQFFLSILDENVDVDSINSTGGKFLCSSNSKTTDKKTCT